MPVLSGDGFTLRPYRAGDEESLSRAADNPAIARNMALGFPNPYTLDDAGAWIARCAALPDNEVHLAIDVGGAVCGGAGVFPRPLWSPYTFELGYWLGEPYWGCGIATRAAALLIDYAFTQLSAERVQAFVYEWNGASRRVLEKNGFEVEGRLRQAVCRDGRRGDCWVYGRLR